MDLSALDRDHARAWFDVITVLPSVVGDLVRDDPEHPDRPMGVCTLGARIEAARRAGEPIELRRATDPWADAALDFAVTDGSGRTASEVADAWLGICAPAIVIRLADLPLALATRLRGRTRAVAAQVWLDYGDEIGAARAADAIERELTRPAGVKAWFLCDHGAAREDVADAPRVTLGLDAELVSGTPAHAALMTAQAASEVGPWGTGTPDTAQEVFAPTGATA